MTEPDQALDQQRLYCTLSTSPAPPPDSLEHIFAQLGPHDTIDSLFDDVERLSRRRIFMNQAFHKATIFQLKRVLRFFEESQAKMEDAKPHKIISLLGDLRQKTSVRKDGIAVKIMALFAADVDGKDRILPQDMERLGNELYQLGKKYKNGSSGQIESLIGEVLTKEGQTFRDMALQGTMDDDSSIGHEVMRRFISILTDAFEEGKLQWLERSSPLKFLSEQKKDLLPWTSVGFVLELFLDSGALRLEDIWFHAKTINRIRKIGTKRIPKFTERLSELIALLENQSQEIDLFRNKLLAGFAAIVAAAGPSIARLAFGLAVDSDTFHNYVGGNMTLVGYI